MINISEDKIHLYILNPSLLSKEETGLIEKEIQSNREFKAHVDEIRMLHTVLPDLNDSQLDLDLLLTKLSHKHKMPGSISLKHLSFGNEEDNDMKLAAMQSTKIGDEYKYVNTFASAEKIVMLRVLKNPSSEEYKLYLICDEMERVKNSVVNFDMLPGDFIADENGVITIHTDYLSKELNIDVHFPVAVFEINLKDLKEKYISDSEGKYFEVKIIKEGNNIQLNFENENHLIAFVIFDEDFSKFIKLKADPGKSVLFELPDSDINSIKIVLIE